MEKRGKRPFEIWFGLAFIVLAPVYIYSTSTNDWFRKPPKPIGDGLCYESIGFSLSRGQGFQENFNDPEWRLAYESNPEYTEILDRSGARDVAGASRPPLLPAIIALVYSTVGRGPEGYMTIRVLASLCLALAGAMAVGLTAQLLASRTRSHLPVAIGSIATLGLAGSSRTLKDYTSDFLTEPLALLLTQLLIVLLVLRSEKLTWTGRQTTDEATSMRNTWLWSVAVGSTFGLMILARSLFVFWMPGFQLLIALSQPGTLGTRLRVGLLATISTVAVCAPWWIHNCWALKGLMPLGTQGPIAMLGGYSQQAYEDGGNWNATPEIELRARLAESLEFREAENDTAREVLVSKAAKIELIDWIQQNKNLLPSLAMQRAITHWNPYWGRAAIWKVLIALGLAWSLIYSGASRWWLIGLPVLSTIVVMMIYETGGRFLVPLYGLLFTLGGLGISGWWARRQD